MNKVLYVIPVLFLLSGCTSKNEKNLIHDFKKEQQYHKQLLKTEKLEIKNSEGVRVLLTATYANRSSNKKNESFIVGVYAEDGIGDENTTTSYGRDFTLSLNGKKPIKAIQLERNNPKVKNISFISEWTSVYELQFPYMTSKKMVLKFNSGVYGNGSLIFYKIPRYRLMRKSIF